MSTNNKNISTIIKSTLLYSVALAVGLFLGLRATALLSQERGDLSSNAVRRAPRSQGEQMVIDAYKKAKDSVVNITGEAEATDMFGYGYQVGTGSGSGFIVDSKRALIVTNYHVIESSSRLVVTLADGQSYSVKIIGRDADNDVALLQIKDPPANLVAADLGTSSSLEVGQQVLAIGNPFGLERTLTSGLVSSLGRSIRTENGMLIEDIIQTDAAINPGNSGGPLLDTAGRVVGINTAIVSKTGEYSGVGFAIPVERVKNAIPQLIEHGRILRPKLGVVMADTDYGVVLLYVSPGSPAEKAGLAGARRYMQRGFFTGVTVDLSEADFVVSVNGKTIQSKASVIDELSRVKEGEEVVLLVRRGARSNELRKVKVRPIMS